ncbi:MAG: hypothetical protein WC370_05100 [Dehalococcoidales bacterium]|jgi:hypothetical protein
MWDWRAKSAIASFCIALGGGGVLGYFEQCLTGLIISVVFVLIGFGLLIWSYTDRKRDHKKSFTSESIKHDLEKKEYIKYCFQLVGLVVLALIFIIGVQIFLYRQTVYIEQTRPILVLEPNIQDVKYDDKSYTANITIEYTLSNLRDNPSYQTQVRFAGFRDIDPSNVQTLKDQYITSPIYESANRQVTETITLHAHSAPPGGQIIFITYTKIRYADAPMGKIHWYSETWWSALTLYFDANSQLIRVANEEVDPSLFPAYEAEISLQFPHELGDE